MVSHSATTLCLLYVPCADADEAKRLATSLLDAKLIACANIIGCVQSLYEWQGEMQCSGEAILLVKTLPTHQAAASALIEAEHSYECPAIVALNGSANAGFYNWASAQVSASAAQN